MRIGDKLMEKWAELGFESANEAEILGEVCRGHRPQKSADGTATWEEIRPIFVVGPGKSVRLRLVSALIYAIDELHLGHDRAPERVNLWREIQDEESRRHWERHRVVRGPDIADGTNLYFDVTPTTPWFEEDLRKSVFHKALGAMRDLRRQAVESGVTADLPNVIIQ